MVVASECDMHGLRYWIFLAGYLGCQVSSKRKMTLTNKHLRIGAVPYVPFITFTQDENGHAIFSGLLGDFIRYIQGARNCTFTVVIPPNQRDMWGDCYANKTCTGMIGLVNRSEVDFAIGTTCT